MPVTVTSSPAFNMKKKPEKRLSLKMITVARLSPNSAQLVKGGAALSGPTGPSGPGGQPDPCASQYQACTMCCTLDCYTVNTPGCRL
jgi:hypothetical protein